MFSALGETTQTYMPSFPLSSCFTCSHTLCLPTLPVCVCVCVCVCAKSSGPHGFSELPPILNVLSVPLWNYFSLKRKRDSEIENRGEMEQVVLSPSPFLWVPGLWPIRPISNNKTHKNTTKPSRQAGRQVVNGGRNCYLSHRQEQRKHSPECQRKNLYLPVFSILQLNSLPQFPVSWNLQRDYSMHCSDFYTCKVVCYVINQVLDNCFEVQRGHNFAAFKRGPIRSSDGCGNGTPT